MLSLQRFNLYSPREVRQFNATAPPAAQIPLPSSFLTLDDILRLPLKSFSTGVGSALSLQRDFRKYRVMDLYRLYAADTWRIGPRLTVNYGLAWSYEPNSLNTDLTKPKLLTAILGPDGLNPPAAQRANFSPTVGFAWAATRDGKTVIRGGAGRYFDPASFNSINIANERQALSPLGTGRRASNSGIRRLFSRPCAPVYAETDHFHRRGSADHPARHSRGLAATTQPGQPRFHFPQHRPRQDRSEFI